MKTKLGATQVRCDPKPKKSTLLTVRLSTALLSPVLFLLLLELVLWLFGYGLPKGFFVPWIYNGKTIHLPNQNYCEHFVPKELSRAPESSVLYPKDSSTIRIFVLGGSAANGDPEPAYGFCRQLEILLNEHSDRISFEVINAAVTSMNSFVACRIAQDCAMHQPDLFIVYMGNNEVVGPFGPPTLPGAFYKSRGFINNSITAQKDLRLGQLVKNCAATLRSTGREPRRWEGMEAFLENKIPQGDMKLKYCYHHFQANIRDVVATANHSGAKTLLCTVPTNITSCAPFASQHIRGLTQAQTAEWDRLFQAGRALEQAGDIQAALIEYEKAQAIDDAYADLAFCMGKCLLAVDKLQEAKAIFIKARDLDTLRFRADSTINQIIRQEASSLAGQGAELLDMEAFLEQNNQGRPLDDFFLVDHVHLNVHGNFQIAWAAMQAIRKVMPQAQLNLHARSANELYELCRKRMLYDVHEQYRLAMLMYYRKTRPPFAGQLGHHTELASLRETLVQLRSMVKQSPDTEPPYVDALKKAPGDEFLIRRYGSYLVQNRRLTEAINTYHDYLKGRPFEMSIRLGLAEALTFGGDQDKAVKVLTAREVPFPYTHREALQYIGNLYVQQGWYDRALSVYQELYKIAPHDVHTLVNLASAASHQGDLTMVKQVLDKALKIDPNSIPALINMGNYYVKRDQTKEAYEWFERAARVDPYNYIPQFSLGMQELKLGRVKDGLKHITESVNLKPDFVQGYQILIKVYNQFDKADVAYKYEILKNLFSPL
jgi:tetratricopeptide (TPR) repeat protein